MCFLYFFLFSINHTLLLISKLYFVWSVIIIFIQKPVISENFVIKTYFSIVEGQMKIKYNMSILVYVNDIAIYDIFFHGISVIMRYWLVFNFVHTWYKFTYSKIILNMLYFLFCSWLDVYSFTIKSMLKFPEKHLENLTRRLDKCR